MSRRLSFLIVAASLLGACSPGLASPTPPTLQASPPVSPPLTPVFETGVYVNDKTGKPILGLWLFNPRLGKRDLLVSHGDATDLDEPMVAQDGSAVYFVAQHPDHFELHRFNLATLTLDTLFEADERLDRPPITTTFSSPQSGVSVSLPEGLVLPPDFVPSP